MRMLRGGGAEEKIKSLNMLLPWGRTAACDLKKQSWVMGILNKQRERGGGKKEKKKDGKKKKDGQSEDVRRRKRNRNINRKGLRSGSCYIWRWLCVLGLEGRGGSIDIRRHCHCCEESRKQIGARGMLYTALRYLNLSNLTSVLGKMAIVKV